MSGGDAPLQVALRWLRFSLRRVLLCVAAICVTLTISLKLPEFVRSTYAHWHIGRVHETLVLAQPNFRFRVTSLSERGTVLAAPGVFYRYEVKTCTEYTWRELATVQVPSLEALTEDRLVAINRNCVYFFDKRLFGVTTDGGVSWSCTSPDSLPIKAPSQEPYVEINSVHIDKLGIGTLNVSVFGAGQLVGSAMLNTSDFGQNWR